jgi:hypothetical protein
MKHQKSTVGNHAQQDCGSVPLHGWRRRRVPALAPADKQLQGSPEGRHTEQQHRCQIPVGEQVSDPCQHQASEQRVPHQRACVRRRHKPCSESNARRDHQQMGAVSQSEGGNPDLYEGSRALAGNDENCARQRTGRHQQHSSWMPHPWRVPAVRPHCEGRVRSCAQRQSEYQEDHDVIRIRPVWPAPEYGGRRYYGGKSMYIGGKKNRSTPWGSVLRQGPVTRMPAVFLNT